MTSPIIETKILNSLIGTAIPLPTYATDGAAGMDLRACINEPLTLAPNETQLINTGIAISIRNPNIMGILAPRSGLGIKHGIILGNTVGIIDSCYQGEIKVGLWNRSNDSFVIYQGDRVCQLLFVPIIQVTLEIVTEFREKTQRGEGGFGHTGIQ